MRSFIAVNISDKIIVKITEIIKYFESKTPEKALKWVSPCNLHLTLKFLGDVPESQIEIVEDIMRKTLQGQKSFQIGVEGLGMFPNVHKPRVVWLGITHGKPLAEMTKQLDSKFTSLDIQPDKHGFSPHLTIARVRRNVDLEIVKEIGKSLSQFKVDSLGTCWIENIVLYRSELTPKGPIYSVLYTNPLNKV